MRYSPTLIMLIILVISPFVFVTTGCHDNTNSAEDSNVLVVMDTTVVLTDSMEEKIAYLIIGGRVAEADSLRASFVAKILLDQRREEAKQKLHAIWDKQITPMTIDQVWEWCDSKKKALWLCKRYSYLLPVSSSTLAAQLHAMKFEHKMRSQTNRGYKKINERLNAHDRKFSTLDDQIAQHGIDISKCLAAALPDSATVQ